MRYITSIIFFLSIVSYAQGQNVSDFRLTVGTEFHYESFSRLNGLLSGEGVPKTDNLTDKSYIGAYYRNGRTQYRITADYYTTEKTRSGSYSNKMKGWGLTATYGYNLLDTERKSSLMPFVSAGWRRAAVKVAGDEYKSLALIFNAGLEYVFRVFTVREIPVEMGLSAGADLKAVQGKWLSDISRENPWGGYFGFAVRIGI